MPRRRGPLWRLLRTRPRVADREVAGRRFADLAVAAEGPELKALLDEPNVRAIVAAIADHSPYLWHLIESEPVRFHMIIAEDPWTYFETLLTGVRDGRDETEAAVMRRLRLAKQELALLVALADLGGVWTLEDVMRALSRAADRFIGVALSHLLRAADAAGALNLPDARRPENGCGLVVLGLGKLGGHELNYSSDVDLIVIFDPSAPAIANRDTCKALFVRMLQDLARILQQPTAQGYVFRVDLRLRPDPGSTAVAIGIDAAFRYYEAVGQNWERAAMIKARPVAGDLVLGKTFLEGLAPFIWRKYFDYASIADVHAMKRQIHAAKGHADITVAGHDVKLGRGGIREIEFFVQTQQLIFGGKRPNLRGSRTRPMLRQLHRDGWIGANVVSDLTRSYDFLRRVEHRLQMLADEQTHRLPRTPDDLERFARFCGFASSALFSRRFTRHLRTVALHYARLFENAPGLDDAGGSLVFTGVEDDPETLRTLAALGYAAPAVVAGMVRDWHSGRRRSVRSTRTRERLTDLVPRLLLTFARGSDPDGAVAAFDKTLDHMPAAGELFAILAANAALRTLFGDVLGGAPRLATEVVLRPHLLDGAIDPTRTICLDETQVEARATPILAQARTTEDVLDAIRDFHHEEHFLIGVALLAGTLDIDDAGRAYAALAAGIVRIVLRHLREDFARTHGFVTKSAVAVVAMGKLGSREMTATSDLDLVLLYTYDDDRSDSDGLQPLHATRYFTRLTQRLVSYLTVASRRGRLYDVDMRLRPTGRQGPIATKLSAFGRYQRHDAATWEHMALTRARVVAGDRHFGICVEAEIAAILRRPPNAHLREDVVRMRMLIEREKPARNLWDLKLSSGALIDIEFLAQYIALRDAGDFPGLLETSTLSILQRAEGLRLLGKERADCLVRAYRLFTNTAQITRLALEEDQTPDHAGAALKRRIVDAAKVTDFSCLSAEIEATRQAVREIFLEILSGD